MSGYRNLHRQRIESTAIWNVDISPSPFEHRKGNGKEDWHVWTASADGLIRSYRVHEKSLQESKTDDLNASALTIECTHVLLGSHQKQPEQGGETTNPPTALGSTRVEWIRNYAGDDQNAGDWIVCSLEMSGKLRIWFFSAGDKSKTTTLPPISCKADAEFLVDNATGTTMQIASISYWGGPEQDVSVFVGCLDGTIAQVAIGSITPSLSVTDESRQRAASPAGTVLNRLGSRGSAIPLCLEQHPHSPAIVVGRQDGCIDFIQNSSSSGGHHRLFLPGEEYVNDTPVRAVAFSPDGQILVAGNDCGTIAVWDINRRVPTLVHHVVQAHSSSWVLSALVLDDSRRFVTCGADRKIHVWTLDQMHQPTHTFTTDQTVWTLSKATTVDAKSPAAASQRLICGTEAGVLQVFSIDG